MYLFSIGHGQENVISEVTQEKDHEEGQDQRRDQQDVHFPGKGQEDQGHIPGKGQGECQEIGHREDQGQ